MRQITRRQAFSYGGAFAAALAGGGWLAARNGLGRPAPRVAAQGSFGLLDPRDPAAFTTPLLLPSRDGGPLGLLPVPAGGFEARAAPIQAELLKGVATATLAYEVRAGGRTFTNPVLHIERGQTLTARLRNDLDEATIIHWHGLHVDRANDGHPADVIGPGATYDYRFPVTERAGLYWYHPHPDMRTGAQVYQGLAGLLLVDDDDDRRLRQSLDLEIGVTDLPILLQDRLFEPDGSLRYITTPMEQHMGLLGETMLVNGTVNPTLDVASRLYRLRLLNGANARTFRLAATRNGQRLPLTLIGTDGGLLEQPARVNDLFLSPGERADVLLDLRDAAVEDVVFLQSLAFDPMHNEMGMGMGGGMGPGMGMGGPGQGMGGMGPMAGQGMSGMGGHQHGAGGMEGTTRVGDGEALYVLRLQVRQRVSYDLSVPAELTALPTPATEGARVRPLTLTMGMMTWFINGERFAMDRDLFRVPRGATEIWEFRNAEQSMPHPMHVHAVQFRVLERLGSPPQTRTLRVDAAGRQASDRGRKDTVLVWPGETVRVAADFSNAFAGDQRYLVHCHVLEHEDGGMMANFTVG